MLKFDFPVYAPEHDTGALYSDYLRGKDDIARSVLLTVMRDVHPQIAQNLDADLGNKLHTFMTRVVRDSYEMETSLDNMRGGFLASLFNRKACEAGRQQAAEKETAYSRDVQTSAEQFVAEQFPDCLKDSIRATHKGCACTYLHDVSNRLNYEMRTKYTSPYEFCFPTF
jgi:hypothetical protein